MANTKTPKIPALFRKPIPEKAFEKKFVKFIEQPKDRELLRAAFVLKNGAFHLKKDADPGTLKKLAELAKAIKANRGVVKTGPLILVVLLAAGLTVFVLFFMNPLLEKALEGALATTFEAQAEVAGFELDLSKPAVRIDALSVADRDQPLTNLFETGRVELRLNPVALFRGKVYIEEAGADLLLFGSPRSVSGALPDYPARQKAAKKPKAAGTPLVDLENFSAEALLEREKSKLASTQAYTDASRAYTEAAERWQAKSEAAQESVAELKTSGAAVLAINVKNLKSADAVAKALSEVKSTTAAAQTVGRETGGVVKGIQGDVDAALALEKAARAAAAADFKHLKAYINPKSGAALEALEPSLKEILSDQAESYVEYGSRGLEVLKKLKEDDDRESASAPEPVAAGRDVHFPSTAYPRFRLGRFHADFSVDGVRWLVELKEASSQPDLVPGPTTLDLAVADAVRELTFKGTADLRRDAKDLFILRAAGSGLAVDAGDALEDAGIGGFTGRAAFTLDGSGSPAGDLSAQSAVSITEGVLQKPEGTLAQALAEAMRTVPSIEVGVGYQKPAGRDARFSITTNLNDLVAAALKATADRYVKQAEAELDAAFKKYVAGELEAQLGGKADADALLGAAKGDQAAADKLTASLDAKKTELENRATAIAKEAAAGALKKVDIPKVKF